MTKIAAEKLETTNNTMPVLFLMDWRCRSYLANCYNQIFTRNNIPFNKFSLPISVLWVGRDWSDRHSSVEDCYVYKDILPSFKTIGCLAEIENIERFSDNSLRLSIATKRRVTIFDIKLNSDEIYYGNYQPYER